MPPSHPQMRFARRLARRKAGGNRIQTFKFWARTWLVPPGLWEAALRFVRRGHPTNRALSPPEHPAQLSDIMFPGAGPEPYWVAVEKIVNRFGQSFTTEQHHFVRYLQSGFDDLERFYRSHQPETALQAHFINETLTGHMPTHVHDAPWRHAPLAETDTSLPIPEAFGPISDMELATEVARLDKVLHSIKKNGFLAGHAGDPGGPINGQIFYKDNGDFRILIFGGNHRTAVLAHLGWDLIPVHNLPGSHPVRLSDSAHWPGVVDGRFTQETAHAMFEGYFRPRHQQLLPGW